MASTSIHIIDKDGNQSWRLRGRLHREDGPAMIFKTGSQFWFVYDILHREDGPAIIYPNGKIEWWLNNGMYEFDEWLGRTPIDEDQKLLLKLQYG